MNVFKNKDKLQEMLLEYDKNFAQWGIVNRLARKYGVHHTSILYQIKRHGIWRQKLIIEGRIVKAIRKFFKYTRRFKKRDRCASCGVLKNSEYYGAGNEMYCEDCRRIFKKVVDRNLTEKQR